MVRRVLPAVVSLLALWPAAEGRAVVAGDRLAPRAMPAVVDLSGCSGTLVAPDRVLTAAHCVGVVTEMPRLLGRTVVGVSWHPRYIATSEAPSHRHGDERADLALLRLSAPVRRVAPLPLLARAVPPGTRAVVVGYGITSDRDRSRRQLHRAALRVTGDAHCGRAWQALGGQFTRAWEAASMLCAADPDGRAPHRAVCKGDSGGPLLVRARGRWHIGGVTAWGGPRCGAQGHPSVFTQVAGEPFLTAEPAWAPMPLPGRPRISGAAAVGETLTCEIPGFSGHVERVEYVWWVNRRGGQQRTPQPVYVVQSEDRRRVIRCSALAYNDGGRGRTSFSADVRVP